MYSVEKVWKDWKAVKLLGKGNFGDVFEIVRNKYDFEEHCALKVISIPKSDAEVKSLSHEGMDDMSITSYYQSIVEDFIQEIVVMSKFKGEPNIVSYEDYEVVRHENDFGWDILIRMELLKPLSDLLKERSLSEEEVVKLCIGLCDALTVCHDNNIIHRDIKIENIFVSKNGVFKLGDFGIARSLEKTSIELSQKGTLTYMAPEVYRGTSYNKSVDIYSLGMVMYKLLNNYRDPFLPQPPEVIKYQDKNYAFVKRMQGDPIPKPVNASNNVSWAILKAMAYYPEDRFESAADFKGCMLAINSGVDTNVLFKDQSKKKKKKKKDPDNTLVLDDRNDVSSKSSDKSYMKEGIFKWLLLGGLVIFAIIVLLVIAGSIMICGGEKNAPEDSNDQSSVLIETESERNDSGGIKTEKEDNDSSNKANEIDLNQVYTGFLDGVYTTEKDWYTFTLDKEMRVHVYFSFDKQATEDFYWDINLRPENDLNKFIWRDHIEGNVTETNGEKFILQPGKYFFEVESANRYTMDNYNFMIIADPL